MFEPFCATCGKEIPFVVKTGRPSKFCSQSCREKYLKAYRLKYQSSPRGKAKYKKYLARYVERHPETYRSLRNRAQRRWYYRNRNKWNLYKKERYAKQKAAKDER